MRPRATASLRFIMENGAKGCEVVVSGKLRGQRGKAMKFKDGNKLFVGKLVREYKTPPCVTTCSARAASVSR